MKNNETSPELEFDFLLHQLDVLKAMTSLQRIHQQTKKFLVKTIQSVCCERGCFEDKFM